MDQDLNVNIDYTLSTRILIVIVKSAHSLCVPGFKRNLLALIANRRILVLFTKAAPINKTESVFLFTVFVQLYSCTVFVYKHHYFKPKSSGSNCATRTRPENSEDYRDNYPA